MPVFFKVEPSQPLNPQQRLPGLVVPCPASSPGAIVPFKASFLHIHLPLTPASPSLLLKHAAPLLHVAGEGRSNAIMFSFSDQVPLNPLLKTAVRNCGSLAAHPCSPPLLPFFVSLLV